MADENNSTNEATAATTEASTTETTASPTETSTASSTTDPTPEPKADLSAKAATTETKTETEAEPNELIGAPAEGEDYVIEGLPEGMAVDPEMLAKATPILRGLNASPAAASQLAGLVAEQMQGAVDKSQAALEQSITETRGQWETEARDLIAGKGEPLKNEAGETLGFDGKSMKEVMATSARVLDKLAPAGFREWLGETGLAVHPHMNALMFQMGKLIAEDRDFETASTTSENKKSTTEKFFGR